MEEPRSFRMDRRSPEAARLREAVSKKLLDFLGNYSDEVLAEYIVVLVCNGKHQNQACDDLEAFLGGESRAFVAWLWDYLSKDMSKFSSEAECITNHDDSLGREHTESFLAHQHADSLGPPKVQEIALHKTPYPQSGNCSRATTNLSSLVTCSREASPTAKRHSQHELLGRKIPADYPITVPAQSIPESKTGQTAMCLRSVIAVEEHQLKKLFDRNPAETSLPEEAIEEDESDQKAHPRGNVWDRLGRPPEDKQHQNPRLMRISSVPGSTSVLHRQSYATDRDNAEDTVADEYRVFDKPHKNNLKRWRQMGEFNSNNNAPFCKEKCLQDEESMNKLSSIKPACILVDAKTTLFAQSQVKEQSSMMVSVENPVKSESHNKIGVQDEVVSVKSKLHQIELDMLKLRSKQLGLRNNGKHNIPSAVQNPPDEDIESRTVMVANVHFAATREALILHFAKCGAIAKIVMLTDSVTAMPKGAAYIVFANKESVNKAISLGGTSFFSRILKVVRKADVPPDFLVPSPPAVKQLQSSYPQAYRKFPTPKQQYASSNLQWRRDQCANRTNPLTTSTGLGSSNPGG